MAQHPKKAIPIDEFERYGIYHDRVRRKCVAVPSQQSERSELDKSALQKVPTARILSFKLKIEHTRKYPLLGYILGVLMHKTAWVQHWGGDETLKCGFKIDYT